MSEEWQTIEELAKAEGIKIDCARKRAQRGQYARKKEGRTYLYKPITEETAKEAAEAVKKEAGELSAQSAYLVAKAKKMQADADYAEIKLNRERLLLYDEIRGDNIAMIQAFTATLREGIERTIDKATADKLQPILEESIKAATERANDLREARQSTKFNADLEAGYYDFCAMKNEEEKAASEARKEKEEAARKRRWQSMTIDQYRMYKMWEIRDHAHKLFAKKPREHQEAQEWQAATNALEVEIFKKTAWGETSDREEIEAIRAQYMKKLDKLASEILA